MSNRLLDFLDRETVLYDEQFGFRAKHSTDQATLSIIDEIQRAIDEKDFSCGIFLVFSKAFDTVNHTILLDTLQYYGIRGMAFTWFKSYMADRQQVVTINNASSDPLPVSCGIPQGSVLGPLLFLLYINDFYLCSDLFYNYLFADDANLFCKDKDILSLPSNISSELNNIHTWLCANKLSLNVDKSNFVIFHPSQRKITFNFLLSICNRPLNREYYIKYLGVLIDANFN